MTRDPAAFVALWRKLAGQNLADLEAQSAGGISVPRSSALAKRIAKAEAWRQSASV